MTQNPYAESGFDDAISEPPRTSVMAILSLVFSLVGCCLPIGLLGSLFGIFSLVGISGSQGRVTGKGLAIAGIIIGLITTGIWGGAYVAMQKGIGIYADMTGSVLADIEVGDFTSARTALSPNVTITDEQFTQFHDAYADNLGSFKGTPDGFIELIQTFADPAIGPSMQTATQGRNDLIPIPGLFDQGPALLLFEFDPQQSGGDKPMFTDIIIVLPDGTEIKLSDPLPETPETPDDGG
jgi:hypothetical protein